MGFKILGLGLLFYRYLSENLTEIINMNDHKAVDLEFDYAKISDEDAEYAKGGWIEEKEVFLYPASFLEYSVKC